METVGNTNNSVRDNDESGNCKKKNEEEIINERPPISPNSDAVQMDLELTNSPIFLPSTDVSRSVSGPLSNTTNGRKSLTQRQNESSKLDALKDWSINTFKCTKQVISEKLGKSLRTIDVELETKIEILRDTQRRYANLLKLSRHLSAQMSCVFATQRVLGEVFQDLSQKSPELQEEFSVNSETQRTLAKNGDALMGALNFFVSSIETLTNKTMEDTMLTIRNYENSRVEYDAYRADVETLQSMARDSNTVQKLREAENKHAYHKEKFEQLRCDVSVKIKFLDENRLQVMARQLCHLQSTMAVWISSNADSICPTPPHERGNRKE